MSRQPILYMGCAAPLVEAGRLWLVSLDSDQLSNLAAGKKEPLSHTLRRNLGAYGFKQVSKDAFTFRTGLFVRQSRVEKEVESCCGCKPQLMEDLFEPVEDLDQVRAAALLEQNLANQPVRFVCRHGLTLQNLQRDLSRLQPEMVVLHCHGTAEGFVMLEDGRAQAHMTPGEKLLPSLQPWPQVLFLSACYSQQVLHCRPQQDLTEGSVAVSVHSETPLEVAAGAAFQGEFFSALLRGETA
ncbi:MAG: hypothetical protein V3T83_18540 [Acidobacteriota bacterium]